MSIEQTEQECAANAKAPRVSLADINEAIAAEYSSTADKMFEGCPTHSALELLTVVVVVLKNGFTVIGKSAPASPENFNADLGHKLAREDAIRQIWPLMGFALRDKLHAASPAVG